MKNIRLALSSIRPLPACIIVATAASALAGQPRGSGLARVAASVVQAQQAAPADKWVTVYGVKLRYLEAGTGPAVILLHGLGGDSSNWAANIGPLSRKYRVIVPDQIGFGKSDKPLINYRVATYVDFLKGLMTELKVDRASLVGNSLGGWIATAFALANPQMVDRLVLVDAAGFALPKDSDPAVLSALNPATRDHIKQLLPLVFYNTQLFASDAAVDAFFARKMTSGDSYTTQRIIESVIRGDDVLDTKLGGVKQPTLIVWGREDKLTPLAMGERFKKEIPGSDLVVFEKCGHVPQMEKPPDFNATLMKFLGGGT